MANSDYTNRGTAGFSTYIRNDAELSPLDTVIDYTVFNFDTIDAINVGDAAMVDDEIMLIEVVGIRTVTVKRGCADTIPARHDPNSIVWVFTNATGSDQVEHSAGETVSVKISPFTMGGGELPIASVTPVRVDFNWRFFRPYPPARMMVNDERWFEPVVIDDTTGSANLTWVHRDRILQADRLLGHDDPTMGPEAGVTYTLRVYTAAMSLLRTEYGIRGDVFMYQQAKALHDMGYPSAATAGVMTFTASRQNFDSWQAYTMAFTVHPSASPIPSQWQAFDQRAFETPYLWQARKGMAREQETMLGVAARPADRMSDDFALVHYWIEIVDTGEVDENNAPIYDYIPHTTPIDANTAYTPWVTIDFRLPELETTINVRSSSLYDGVTTANVAAGSLMLIDDEIVVLRSFNDDGTITIGRGVADTVPAVHIAGARVWLFEADPAFDPNAVGDYRFMPGVYGDPVDAATLPRHQVASTQRPRRPYPMGQLVVNGRPWFEEAQATSGAPVTFSWTWRNRVLQGTLVVAHDEAGGLPEAGETARLRFYYETPAATPNGGAVQHTLRTLTAAPATPETSSTTFQYSYANAVSDGNTAGQATGVCGTVLIYCELSTVRDSLQSHQSYIIPIRVPSFPCPA